MGFAIGRHLIKFYGTESGDGCKCKPVTTSSRRGSLYGLWVATVGCTCNFWKSTLGFVFIDEVLHYLLFEIIHRLLKTN